MPETAGLCRNVYYDTAAVPFLYDVRIYRVALAIIGTEKMLLGSDFPLLRPGRYIEDMKRSGVTDREIHDVAEGNARRLLVPDL
jgi:hypothetical protein